MADIAHTASLGGGVIGASWSALFLASGRSVALYDPAPEVEQNVRAYIKTAWPVMTELGLTEHGDPDAISFHTSAKDAVQGADFIQESVPERLDIKHTLFAEIEPALSKQAILASSASGLTLSQMQPGWRDPSRMVLGHPFNPPHLIPLVEICGNAQTAAGVVEAAESFYKSVGKVTIRLNKEMPGHVANRLQAALWREAIHLATTGVASVEDIDKAIWAGPGLRWAAMGPTMLFNLAAGKDGLAAFCAHFGDTFDGWWADMGQVHMTSDVVDKMVAGATEAAHGQSQETLGAKRDALVVALQKSTRGLRS